MPSSTSPELLTPAMRLHLYREMVRIRHFDQQTQTTFSKAVMGGWLFGQVGQESIAVAVRSLFGSEDHSISGHRSMGHAIAAGVSMASLMAEFCGRATGISQGRGGAEGWYAPEHNFWGAHTAATSQTPVAAGLALHLKLHHLAGVVVCFLGDGAVNQGVYHESLNLAALLGLPVIYLIENNGYAGGTSVARSSAYKGSLAQRADGYGIAFETLEGWDVEEVHTKLSPWFVRARTLQLPAVLEISTYRVCGWAISDAGSKKYRTPEEIEFHQCHRDPILLQRDRLLSEGLLTPAANQEIIAQAKQEAIAAEAFALASPYLRLDQITEHVWS